MAESSIPALPPELVNKLTNFIRDGVEKSVDALSKMVGREVRLMALDVALVNASDLLVWLTDEQTPTVGIYVLSSNGPSGSCHLMLLFTTDAAITLAQMLVPFEDTSLPGGDSQLTELQVSALSETGNVVSSYFLSHMERAAGLQMYPLPPYVVYDMTGAILDTVIADLSTYGDASLVLDTAMTTESHQLRGQFLVMFDDVALHKLEEALKQV
jgi:chemotaxis protein CheC